jgi:serine/threonine-protein kinase
MVSEVDAMVLVFVPAGEFQMGSNISYDGQPVHTVYLDAFWIDQTEVTNQQYAEFLNDMDNQTEGGSTWMDAGSKYVRIHQTAGKWRADFGYSDHPVVEVSWYGASAYCDWAGRMLPTEAMWEKAARGADERIYPWGEGIGCSLAQYGDCGGGTVPVGSYPDGASPYGALDMTGNVVEWMADLYDINYYSNSPYENPQGPSTGYYVMPLKPPVKHYRVLRGGAYNSVGWVLQAAARGGGPPEGSYPGVGFRCAVSHSP